MLFFIRRLRRLAPIMAAGLAAARRCTPPVERREDFFSREGAKARICRGGPVCPPFFFSHAKARRREEEEWRRVLPLRGAARRR